MTVRRGQTVFTMGGRLARRVRSSDGLRLRPAGALDVARFVLAGADEEAQRWLGLRPDQLVAPSAARRMRRMVRGDASGPPYDSGDGGTMLAAFIGADYVGGLQVAPVEGTDYAVVVAPGSSSLGGVVVAPLRGRGIGSRMFALGAAYAHDVLGVRQVAAACPAEHPASGRALLNAGFASTEGPAEHVLPDGRALTALWFSRTWA
jgi:RimJ/RimL family protein N-acetyltransferase